MIHNAVVMSSKTLEKTREEEMELVVVWATLTGLRCASGGLRAESCEKTVACQSDVLSSDQMDTWLQTWVRPSKSAGTNPDLLLTSWTQQTCSCLW